MLRFKPHPLGRPRSSNKGTMEVGVWEGCVQWEPCADEPPDIGVPPVRAPAGWPLILRTPLDSADVRLGDSTALWVTSELTLADWDVDGRGLYGNSELELAGRDTDAELWQALEVLCDVGIASAVFDSSTETLRKKPSLSSKGSSWSTSMTVSWMWQNARGVWVMPANLHSRIRDCLTSITRRVTKYKNNGYTKASMWKCR